MKYRTKTKDVHMIECMEVRRFLGDCYGMKCLHTWMIHGKSREDFEVCDVEC